VNPNELDKEREYLVAAIAGTRKAYGLDKIETREFPAEKGLTLNDIERNAATIDNIKIWDHGPLRETYKQLQVIRLYYDFPNISIDRYRIGENYWQVMLSARELIHGQLPPQSQTWVNRHLQYTHGYGVCLSPVNQSGEEGLPDLWIKDIPPEARHPDLKVERPELYYGLESHDYVLVKTTTQEFDYPKGDENVYTTYEGQGGVNIGSFFRRLLFAIRFADVNLLFTEHLQAESRILFNRSIQTRIATVAPFLMLEKQPYITVADGRMFWIQDAYTISYRYPYSQPTSLGRRKRLNYIRNSVKVVVDAFDGTTRFYVWDDSDPMIQTYAQIFPDLFTIQAKMYESFHMTNARVFYNQEDKWDIAKELERKIAEGANTSQRRLPGTGRAGKSQPTTKQSSMSPYYMIMKLPEQEREEFLLMVPFTPTNKDNMVAWMTARCDGDDYGKLLVYTFPKQRLVFGPMQILARIDQNAEISEWITLRNDPKHGSEVIRGELLVIPIEQSVLYVEPMYLQATQSELPELRRVIVAFDQRLAMKPTLDEALQEVFGVEQERKRRARAAKRRGRRGLDKAPEVHLDADPALEDLPGVERVREAAAAAIKQYRQGESRLARGDWAGYGEAQTKLQKQLERLARLLNKRIPTTRPAPSQSAGQPPTSQPAP
jgi:uncharacterized membrane protein (UPF0182 family)